MATVDYGFSLKYIDNGLLKLYLTSPISIEMQSQIGDAKTYNFKLPYTTAQSNIHEYHFRLPYTYKLFYNYYIFKLPYLFNSKPIPRRFDFLFEYKSETCHPFSYDFRLPYKDDVINPIIRYGNDDEFEYNSEYNFRVKYKYEQFAVDNYYFTLPYEILNDAEDGIYEFKLGYQYITGSLSPLISYEIINDSIEIILDRLKITNSNFFVIIDNGNKYIKYIYSVINDSPVNFVPGEYIDINYYLDNTVKLTIKKIDLESTFSISFLDEDNKTLHSKVQSIVIPAEPIEEDADLSDHRVVTLPGSPIRARFQLPDECCLSKKVTIDLSNSNSACAMPDVEDKFIVPDRPQEYYEAEYGIELQYINNGFVPGIEYSANIQYGFPILTEASLILFDGNNFLMSTDLGETWQIQESYDNLLRQNISELIEDNAVIEETDIFRMSPGIPELFTQEIVNQEEINVSPYMPPP